MKKIYSFLTSLPFMAFLFLALGFSMAIATFIESSYGTPAARALVYNTIWFEVLWGLFALNLVNNLVKYKFLTKKRFTLGLFHISFLVILLGAAITRFFSYEGVMHIRENTSSKTIQTSDDYFYAGYGNQHKEKKVRFSEFTPKRFSARFDVKGVKVNVKSIGFISDADRKVIPSENGKAIIDFVFSSPTAQGMQTYPFTKGDVLDYPGFTVGFESPQQTAIKFFMKNGELFMTTAKDIQETTMATQETVTFNAGDTIQAKKMFLYGYGDYKFLIRNFYPSATYTAVKSQNQTNEDAVMIQISDGINQQTVPVFGHSGVAPDTISVPLGTGALKLAYGSLPITVPFSIYLKDFQLERYPGSQSPSSFASEVVLSDPSVNLKKDVRIFMNNTLMYKGYKFFQSSYDQDEKGTVLSVNHDFWGTWITYIGYILLVIGIILSLVNKNSYFQFLVRKLKQSSVKTLLLILLIGGFGANASAQVGIGTGIPKINDQLVKEFSELWVQGVDGRIEPISTMSSEIVRKISRKSSLYGRTPDEVVLSMMTYPEIWRTLPIVKVSNKLVAAQLGVSGNYVTVQQLFDAQGNYKIQENVQAAYSKAPAFRNQTEKEYIYLDERINICFMVFQGSMFSIYPRINHQDKWYAPGVLTKDYSGGDSIFVKSGFQLMLQSIAQQNNADAQQVLRAIANFQKKYGGNLIPSDTKKNVEILYNKINPFKRIFPFYLSFGFLLLLVLFINIFRQKPLPKVIRISFFGIIFVGFLMHTAGLVVRWYISGHAPWSNGFESIVY
ncbi:MAG TPA: cytochrome c biogenesis protein ResB, partial [Draconibacterium sp.]|nr:cytochrome c biogenesis protein ResB [Draconibacterium sp.]